MERSWAELESLARRASQRDEDAWTELLAELDGLLQVLVRRQRIGRLRGRDDDVRDIATRVYAKLRANELSALRRYFSSDSRPSFRTWIAVVTRSCAIDHLRQHPEYRRTAEEDDDHWVSLATLRTGDGVISSDSLRRKRDRVLADLSDLRGRVASADVDSAALAAKWRVRRIDVHRLRDRGETYERVLHLLFAGHSYTDIARELGCTRREVELTVAYVQELMSALYRAD